jgi:hypothetical protein
LRTDPVPDGGISYDLIKGSPQTLKWPLFKGWVLGHGSFIFAWPILSFGVSRGIRRFRKLEI